MPYTITDYKKVMLAEQRMLNNPNWDIPPSDSVFHICNQLEQTIRSCFVLRANSRSPYRNSPALTPETISAHTSIMRKLVDSFMSYTYGPELDSSVIPGGYTYREVVEAISRHDLPENDTGDTPDNNNRNEAEKNRIEAEWWKKYATYSLASDYLFDKHVNKLLSEMVHKSTTMGRILYVADKLSAILSSLYLDKYDLHPPRMSPRSRHATLLDREEMSFCDHLDDKGYKASEMWTIDFLKLRKRVKYDDTGFFTAVLVMYTMMVNQKWYTWRECDYLIGPKNNDNS